MTIVKISKGEAHLLDFLPRGVEKKYSIAQTGNMKRVMKYSTEEVRKARKEGKSEKEIEAIIQKTMDEQDGSMEIGIEETENARDVLVLGVVDKLIVEGKEVSFNEDYLAKKMSSIDFKLILSEAQKLLTQENPKV